MSFSLSFFLCPPVFLFLFFSLSIHQIICLFFLFGSLPFSLAFSTAFFLFFFSSLFLALELNSSSLCSVENCEEFELYCLLPGSHYTSLSMYYTVIIHIYLSSQLQLYTILASYNYLSFILSTNIHLYIYLQLYIFLTGNQYPPIYLSTIVYPFKLATTIYLSI